MVKFRDDLTYREGEFCPFTGRPCMRESCALWVDAVDVNNNIENGCSLFVFVHLANARKIVQANIEREMKCQECGAVFMSDHGSRKYCDKHSTNEAAVRRFRKKEKENQSK